MSSCANCHGMAGEKYDDHDSDNCPRLNVAPQPSTGGSSPLPPEGCTCGALWTVRRVHGKKDCPFRATPTATTEEEQHSKLFDSDFVEWLRTNGTDLGRRALGTGRFAAAVNLSMLKTALQTHGRRIALEAQRQEFDAVVKLLDITGMSVSPRSAGELLKRRLEQHSNDLDKQLEDAKDAKQ